MPDTVVPTALEDIERAGDIAVEVHLRVGQRISHPGLRPEMHHALEVSGGEQRAHPRPVGEIQALEREARQVP